MALSSSHWGMFHPIIREGKIVEARSFPNDPDPSQLLQSIPSATHHSSRVLRPAIRKSWIENGPGANPERRGVDPYVEVDWNVALDLVAAELNSVIKTHGNTAIFGGSYGWASAGRFHHAKSQLRRFLNTIGGFTDSVDTYSNAAGSVLVRRVLGDSASINGPATSWSSIAAHTDLVVTFGGFPLRNTQITVGGGGEHTTRRDLEAAKTAGVSFINISPIRDDTDPFLNAKWLAPRPGSDTAIILALIHTLLTEGLCDPDFAHHYATGFDTFSDYVLGKTDTLPKNAEWAAAISELTADEIRGLARKMAAGRTFLNMNWSLQRADHGEQPFWALIALAVALGQIGLPGGGFSFGYGSLEGLGGQRQNAPRPTFPVLQNPIDTFIPVARIADMLLSPGGSLQYDGQELVYPDIRLVYWAGGNPFHHHQDLNRLIAAWRCPETIIVHEPWWTATTHHADIVLPATLPLERNDIGATSMDRFMVAMQKALDPPGQARHDFDIFSDLADRMGVGDAFHENRDEAGFLHIMYDDARERATEFGLSWPDFQTFWTDGFIEIPQAPEPHVLYADFRSDPQSHPLATPSGRIEIVSETIAGFGYEDCAGHPMWIAPKEWLGASNADFPLHLLSTQPSTRLHGQMDMGKVSQDSKVSGREPIHIHPKDAEIRGISDTDIVVVLNDRGSLLAGAVISDAVRQGVVQIATGAWFDPLVPGKIGSLEKHGNPNVLTPDRRTSKLAQGPAAQSVLVQIKKFSGDPPQISAFTSRVVQG